MGYLLGGNMSFRSKLRPTLNNSDTLINIYVSFVRISLMCLNLSNIKKKNYCSPTLHSHLLRYRSIFCDGIIAESSNAKSLFNCRLRIAHQSAKGGCFRWIIVPSRWNNILASSLFFLNYISYQMIVILAVYRTEFYIRS